MDDWCISISSKQTRDDKSEYKHEIKTWSRLGLLEYCIIDKNLNPSRAYSELLKTAFSQACKNINYGNRKN